jgi:hypothetical protein
MSVLDRHQCRGREDDMAGRLVGGAEIGGGEQPTSAGDGELNARVCRGGAGFMPNDVRFLPDDDVVARPGQDLEADLVRHRAARHK